MPVKFPPQWSTYSSAMKSYLLMLGVWMIFPLKPGDIPVIAMSENCLKMLVSIMVIYAVKV